MFNVLHKTQYSFLLLERAHFSGHLTQYVSFRVEVAIIYTIFVRSDVIAFTMLSFNIFTVGISQRRRAGTGRSRRVAKHTFSDQNIRQIQLPIVGLLRQL